MTVTEITASRGAGVCDVLVIGGGIAGAVILSALARRGLRATLVERARIGSGTTGVSGAMVRVFHTTEGLNDLALASFPDYLRFEELYGRSCGFEKTGALYFTDRASMAKVEHEVARLTSSGAVMEIVGAREGMRRFPAFMWDERVIAIHEPEAGYVDAMKTTHAWLDDARHHGAEVLEGTPVTGWIYEDHGVRGVKTPTGDLRAAVVVLAAGSWSFELLDRLGDCLGPHRVLATLPETRTGTIQTTDIHWMDAMRAELKSHPCFFDYRTRTYGRPRGDGRSIVGHGLSSGGPATLDGDLSPDRKDSAETLSRLRSIVPVLGAGQVEGGVRSHDAFTDGYVPYMMKLLSGLVVAVGMSGGGFKIAPQVGREVAGVVERALGRDREGFREMSEEG